MSAFALGRACIVAMACRAVVAVRTGAVCVTGAVSTMCRACISTMLAAISACAMLAIAVLTLAVLAGAIAEGTAGATGVVLMGTIRTRLVLAVSGAELGGAFARGGSNRGCRIVRLALGTFAATVVRPVASLIASCTVETGPAGCALETRTASAMAFATTSAARRA